MKNLITVLFEPTRRKTNVSPGISLLEAAHKAGVTIRSECGGKGACGKCRVMVPDKNAVTEITEDENKHLSLGEISLIDRYLFQLHVIPDCMYVFAGFAETFNEFADVFDEI